MYKCANEKSSLEIRHDRASSDTHYPSQRLVRGSLMTSRESVSLQLHLLFKEVGSVHDIISVYKAAPIISSR